MSALDDSDSDSNDSGLFYFNSIYLSSLSILSCSSLGLLLNWLTLGIGVTSFTSSFIWNLTCLGLSWVLMPSLGFMNWLTFGLEVLLLKNSFFLACLTEFLELVGLLLSFLTGSVSLDLLNELSRYLFLLASRPGSWLIYSQ